MVDINEIKDILKRKDFEAFIPILVSDDLLKFELEEVKPLFTDKKYNLMKTMMFMVQNYEKELDDDIFDAREMINCFTWQLEEMLPNIMEAIDYIIGDPEIKDLSCLLDEQLFKWYDHADFFKKFNQPSIFNQVLRYLYNNYINLSLKVKFLVKIYS